MIVVVVVGVVLHWHALVPVIRVVVKTWHVAHHRAHRNSVVGAGMHEKRPTLLRVKLLRHVLKMRRRTRLGHERRHLSGLLERAVLVHARLKLGLAMELWWHMLWRHERLLHRLKHLLLLLWRRRLLLLRLMMMLLRMRLLLLLMLRLPLTMTLDAAPGPSLMLTLLLLRMERLIRVSLGDGARYSSPFRVRVLGLVLVLVLLVAIPLLMLLLVLVHAPLVLLLMLLL
mmetsp:Transcript_11761/g.37707  ORF Transcript_11761/g.37707 Transcript_11761/m.37707 type:complete len:228 (-) Transcript_11761:788-1471(-)